MLTSLRALARRVFAVIAFAVLGVWRLLRWLLTSLLGRWQPPLWLRALGRGLCRTGRWMRAHPRPSIAMLTTLILLGAGGSYAWHWHKHRPQPHTVRYTVHAPALTAYQRQPIEIDGLRIDFAESAAPLDAIG